MIHDYVSACLVAACLVAATVGAASAGPLDALRGTRRVLLVAAPTDTDAALQEQHRVFAAMAAEARERDLVLVEAVGDTGEARSLRARFVVPEGRFEAVLIGKDGGAKLRSFVALGPDTLLPTIDAMPMRRKEMDRRRP